MSTCKLQDDLRQRIIPPLSWPNDAEESICRIPPNLPRMAVFDIQKVYEFTNEEYDLVFVPEYIEFADMGQGQTNEDACADETNTDATTFTWVSWYKTVKELQKERKWMIEPLMCVGYDDMVDPDLKQPGIPMQFSVPLVLVPPVDLGIHHHFIQLAPNTNDYELKNKFDNLTKRAQDLQKEMNAWRYGSGNAKQYKFKGRCGVTVTQSGGGGGALTNTNAQVNVDFKLNLSELVVIEEEETKGLVTAEVTDCQIKFKNDFSDVGLAYVKGGQLNPLRGDGVLTYAAFDCTDVDSDKNIPAPSFESAQTSNPNCETGGGE